MAAREKYGAPEHPLGFLLEHVLMSAKHMSVRKLLFVCVLVSEVFTFLLSMAVCYAWLGEFPLDIMLVGIIDSFAVSLVVCAGLVFMLVRLRESDRALTEEKRLDDTILATMKDAICILDPSYKILFQNDAHKFLNGSHVDRICYQAYRGRQEPCEMCPVEMTLRDGGFHRVEKRVNTNAGLRYLDMSSSPVLDQEGRIKAVIEVIRDTTDYKRAASAANVGEEMFRQLSERLDAVTWLSVGHGGRVLYVSPSFRDLWGRSASEAYGDPGFLARFAHEDDKPHVKAALKKSELGEQAEVECRIIRPDGGVTHIRAAVIPLVDELGEVSRVVGIASPAGS